MRADRKPEELRPILIERAFTEMTPGSVHIAMGRTRVLCTASVSAGVPPWLVDSGTGWVTAEYSMLPGSGRERVSRGSISGGRVKEIQRLIGRSLRAVVDMEAMPNVTFRIDCDVLQADGGTRTASITGAWVALWDAAAWAVAEGWIAANPIVDHCAAVSVGMVDGVELLDLAYDEDVNAEVDANVVMTGMGKLIEVQGTAEGIPFTREQLDRMLDLAESGIARLVALQREAIGS